jgi:outer membrane protein TolC
MRPAAALELTVDGIAEYARQHSPQLAAARFRIEEARGRLEGAGRLSNPELELEFAQNVRMPERVFAAAFVQRFPLTARLRLEKAVSAAQVAAAVAEVRNAERKLAAEARAAAVKLVALRQQQGLREKLSRTNAELFDFMTKRVQAGETSLVETTQVQLEGSQIDASLLLVESERVALLGELRSLLGIPGVELRITGELPPPSPAAGAGAGERADLEAARHHATAAREGAALVRAGKWSDFGFGLTAEHSRTEDAPEGYSRDTMLGFRFSLPLPLWDANEGPIREARATAARAEQEARALSLQIQAESRGTRDEMQALAKIIGVLDEQLIPQAQQIEEQLQTSYTTGQAPLTEVVRARGRRFELEVQRLQTLRDYHLARTRHLAATGAILRESRVSKSNRTSK